MPTESSLRISLPVPESNQQTCVAAGFSVPHVSLTVSPNPGGLLLGSLHARQFPQGGQGPAFPDPKCLEFVVPTFWVFKRENYQCGLCLTWWCRILADFRFTYEALKILVPGLHSRDSFSGTIIFLKLQPASTVENHRSEQSLNDTFQKGISQEKFRHSRVRARHQRKHTV